MSSFVGQKSNFCKFDLALNAMGNAREDKERGIPQRKKHRNHEYVTEVDYSLHHGDQIRSPVIDVLTPRHYYLTP
jgi:hypothetical protein